MNPIVLATDDIKRNLPPMLRPVATKWLINSLFRLLDIDKVNEIHAKYCHLRGAAFTSAMLNDPMMDVRYEVHNREILDQLPDGAFLTVSNHPIGSLDGIALIDLFASLRPDFKVMVNRILSHISAMGDNFISIVHKTVESREAMTNAAVIRLALTHLQEGHPLGFFPAGSMSFYNCRLKAVRDIPWSKSVIRLIRKTNAPVFPVFFDCLNSAGFYRVGRLSWKLRTLFVAREAFNKQGRTIDIYLRPPIMPEVIKSYKDDEALATFLYNMTYGL
ncbi:MAG: lysophospholipid acyltransferase family protein [Tannerella sp.]|jgi:putative hemolysin|nr:lysophospholipid acyltransferase family protein [Tannerella sp.]